MWLTRMADKCTRRLQTDRRYIILSQYCSCSSGGQVAVNLATSNIKDFVAAYDLSVFNPILLGGIFIGAMMAFLFSAMSMKAVGRAAGKMVDEVRRQFREIPGIMEGTGKPEYAKCVEISTAGAQREMLVPSLMAIAVPLLVGIIFGVPGVIGLLAGGMSYRFCSCKYA